MKKVFYTIPILIVSILFSVQLTAQGVHQLWGITTTGGTEDLGAIFKANGDGTNAQGMFSFTRENSGTKPMYNQLAEYNGKFYAMTLEGGSNNLGVIFEWDPATNAYAKKYDFDGANGSSPYGSLVLYNNKFYGMTITGGANNFGVIFEWNPTTNVYTKKYDFDGTNGSNPYGSVTELGGKLYGMTNTGGTNSQGVIFEWDPATNTYTKKYDFNGTDGGNPHGYMSIYSGKFYGLTNLGGVQNDGVIFEWDPVANIYTKKHDLGTINTVRYGDHPFGSLVLESGKFYYMTNSGGSSNGKGGIFEWDPVANVAALRIAFGGLATVEEPYGNLLFENGKFYGMGSIRGTGFPQAQGGLFEWDPVTNVYTTKYQYNRGSTVHLGYTGATPFGSLVTKAGKIYGMTSAGGDDNKGVIFEFDPVASTYTKKFNFMGSPNGRLPESGLSYDGTTIHGVTKRGGSEGSGIIFEWDLGAGQFNKKLDFNPGIAAAARMPVGTMTLVNGKYYGVTWFEDGVVFASVALYEWDPVTNVYTVKSTSGILGRLTNGKLVESGGKLYGMNAGRDGSTNGGIFSYDIATNAVVRLYSFDQPNPNTTISGSRPVGGLTVANGKLYGVTSLGGANNGGTLFEINIATGTFTKKYDFPAGTGANGTMVLHNGVLYGTTRFAIFEWNPVTDTYTSKYAFNGTDGSFPNGGLLLENGKLYGLTTSGGANNLGVIFEWDPATNTYIKKSDFDGSNGRSPDVKNNLVSVLAPVARGIANSCLNLSAVTIDATNSHSWVPVLDSDGNVVAEINANGNLLGTVNTGLYINDGPVRQNQKNQLVLDRNIEINSQNEPDSAVDIRFYLLASELEAIKNAVNSQGDSSGVHTIDDLGILTNDKDDCGGAHIKKGDAIATTGSAWGADYVLTASVEDLQMFYFSGAGNESERGVLELTGELQTNNNVLLTWKTKSLNAKEFIVERSIDGTVFTKIGTIRANDDEEPAEYNFANGINTIFDKPVHYRLKQTNANGLVAYSKTITFQLSKNAAMLYPNPVINNDLKLAINLPKAEVIRLQIVDANGKLISNQTRQVAGGQTSLSIDVSKMAKGLYFITVQSKSGNKQLRFAKQ